MKTIQKKIILFINQTPAATFTAILLILIHAGLSWRLYMNHAFIPDEILFLEHIGHVKKDLNLHFFHPLKLTNFFGYGSLYWFGHYLFSCFSDIYITTRLFYWMILVLSNVLLFLIVLKKNYQRVDIVILFLLTLPMVWWQGKITGPEPLSHFLLVSSLFCLIYLNGSKKILASGLFFGFAVGVKLTIIPSLPFLLYFFLFDSTPVKKPWGLWAKNLFIFGVVSIVGFILANPYLLIEPQKLLSPYYAPKLDVSNSVKNIIFGNPHDFWEAVPQGSLNFFGGAPIVIGMIFSLSLVHPKTWLRSLFWLFSIILTVILSLRTPGYFGWYFYSSIMLMPLLLIFPEPKKIQTKAQHNILVFTNVMLVLIVAVSAILNASTIIDMAKNKLLHIEQLNKSPSIKNHVNDLLQTFHPETIVDFSEFNILYDFLDTPQFSTLELFGTKERRKYEGFDWLWPFVHTWMKDKDGKVVACSKLQKKKKVLIMAGERLINHRDIWQVSFRSWIQKSFVDACPSWEIVYYELYEKIHFVVLEDKNHSFE